MSLYSMMGDGDDGNSRRNCGVLCVVVALCESIHIGRDYCVFSGRTQIHCTQNAPLQRAARELCTISS